MSCTASICSKVAVTAAAPTRLQGTKTDQNWAPTWPRRSRGRSVCNWGWALAMSVAVKS